MTIRQKTKEKESEMKTRVFGQKVKVTAVTIERSERMKLTIKPENHSISVLVRLCS